MKRVILLIIFVVILSISCSKKVPAEPDEAITPSEEYLKIKTYTGLENFAITRSFITGFESVNDFDGYYIVPQDHSGTASHDLTSTAKVSGNYSHYAWIYGTNSVIPATNTNHRGYPTVQMYKDAGGYFKERVFVEFKVRLNITLENTENKEWFSFATFTSYSNDDWSRTVLVNLDDEYKVHLMHVPGQSLNVHDIIQRTDVIFPMNTWVALCVYIDYTSDNEYGLPYAKVWQDGVLVSGATFNPRIDPNTVDPSLWPACLSSWGGSDIAEAETLCSLTYTGGLSQAHFGLYAPPLISSGECWNDDLAIYEIAVY